MPGWINCHFTLALLLRLIHHPSKMKRIFANLLTLSLIFMKCLLSHFFKQIKQMANQCLNQSLYFFFCSSPQLFSSLRLYLTLQLKFFDGIMFIFIIATTYYYSSFFNFSWFIKKINNKIKKKNHFAKKKKKKKKKKKTFQILCIYYY